MVYSSNLTVSWEASRPIFDVKIFNNIYLGQISVHRLTKSIIVRIIDSMDIPTHRRR